MGGGGGGGGAGGGLKLILRGHNPRPYFCRGLDTICSVRMKCTFLPSSDIAVKPSTTHPATRDRSLQRCQGNLYLLLCSGDADGAIMSRPTASTKHSKTSITRTPMARLSWLF